MNIWNLSQFSSRQEWENYIWKEFLKRIAKTKSTNKLHYILDGLLTDKEKENIIRRLIAIYLIRNGENYRAIGEVLWLSPNTVSAIKKSLKNNSGYKSYFDISKNKNNQKTKKNLKSEKMTFEDLGEALENFINWFGELPISPITGKGRWRFLRM